MRILLIDDDDTTVRFLGFLLRKATVGEGAFEVERAASLFEALRLLDEADDGYDAIVLDLGLPECGGLTTLKLVRGHSPGVPVVVVTAQESPEVEREAYRVGAGGYLLKGHFDGETLRRALETAANIHRPDVDTPELRGTFLQEG